MRNFNAVPAFDYIGAPFYRPLNYGGIAGMGIPLAFNWISYGASTANPNICVKVSLKSQETAKRVPSIRSVYIDNMNSNTPIYVYFPDTQYAVVCKPNCSGWYKAYTGELAFWVIGLGFVTNDIPSTSIIVTNLEIENAIDVEIDSAVALWKASAAISRGNTIYNQDFGTPALGDQTVQYTDFVTALNQILEVGLWTTPRPSGFIYLTHVDFSAFAPAALAASFTFVVESLGISGILYTQGGQLYPNAPAKFLNFSAMNIKLDATETWRMRVIAFGGVSCTLTSSFNFTHNPD